MAMAFKRSSAVLSETVGAEDAEALLEWLLKHPKGKVDLSACTHLHPANLQVLMASRCAVQKFPADEGLKAWLESALGSAPR